MSDWKYGRPVVGVGALCLHQGRVLMIRRNGPHGNGMWAPPGGWLELEEDFFPAAEREALKEAGVRVRAKVLLPPTNNVSADERIHSITCWVLCEYESGTPTVMEPETCPQVEWVSAGKVWALYAEDRLLLPMKRLVEREGAGFFGPPPPKAGSPAPEFQRHRRPTRPSA